MHTPYESTLPATERPMPKYIRRSLLALSADDPALAVKASASWADAVLLDLARPPGIDWQAHARARMPVAIAAAGSGGAEVFVRIRANALVAETDASVFTGLAGIVLGGVGGPQDLVRAAQQLAALEASRGIEAGTVEIDVEVDTAAAVWHALEIARASERFGAFILNEPALARALGMQTRPELAFDPLEYVKSQLITVATSVGGQALGMSYPLGLTEERAEGDALRAAVRTARDTGFKGALCPDPSWIAACNEGFRPSTEEAAYYEKVIEVFAEGLRRGMASVPLDGKMIDVPVDLRAKVYLAWAKRAAARDDAKAAAHRGAA
jgi:citrate lyase subunit beta/citryl-CoA lyase